MPKHIAFILTAVLSTVVLFGCQNLGVPKHEYDVLKEDNSRLAVENQKLIRQAKDMKAEVAAAMDRAAAAEVDARTAQAEALTAHVGVFHEVETANKLPDEYTVNRDTGGIVLDQAILFDPGKATLRPGAKDVLQRLVENVLNTPEYREFFVRVDGHSDATPVKATSAENIDNWWLSAKRAHTVMLELGKLGVAQERLYIVGHGPTVPREKFEKSALNRRVEIMVKKKKFNLGTETVTMPGSGEEPGEGTEPGGETAPGDGSEPGE